MLCRKAEVDRRVCRGEADQMARVQGEKRKWVLESSLERTFSEDGEDESGLRDSSEPVIVPGQEQNQSIILENESGRGVDVRLE